MSGAVCPACGVAVMPGYVRCPKCRKPLPRRRLTTQVSGGTALASSGRLGAIAAIAAAVLVGGGIIAYFGLRSGPPATQPVAIEEPQPDEPLAPEPDTFTPPETPVIEQPADPVPVQVAADLERNLKRQRLWATVTIVGERVDVRSGSCGEPAMAAQLDATSPALKAAGLTRLRCLEQSGRVVSTRDL
jgi:hypothetical protein